MVKRIFNAKCWRTRKNGPMVIVIPKKITEKLKIESGTVFFVSSENDEIVFKIMEKES